MFKTAIASAVLVFAAGPIVAAADPWPAASTNSSLNIGKSLDDFEPSDVAWDSNRRTLFVVDDNGRLAEIDLLGNVKKVLKFGQDLEGVTLADSPNPNVYVGQERDATVIEINPDSGPTGRQWHLTEMVTGRKNYRLESLTFVPNAGCHEIAGRDGKPYNSGRGSLYQSGGLFLAGHQGNGRIYIYDLDLSKSGGATLVNVVGPFRADGATLTDMSALSYHRTTGTLYVIWDEENRLAAIDLSKPGFAVERIWSLPSDSIEQEGIAFIDDGCDSKKSRVVIAEDDKRRHRVWLMDGFPVGPCKEASAPTTQKSH